MWKMTQICGKWLKYLRSCEKYLGNDVDPWEMAQICGQMALLFDKRPKGVENDCEIWEMDKIFGKWFKYMRFGLSI